MPSPTIALFTLAFALLATTTHAAKIPEYVHLCKRSVPNFDQCLTKTIESIRPHLAKGIPKMKIPALEPLVIPALEINRNNDALQVKAKLKDVQAYGGTNFIVNRLKTNVDKLGVDVSLSFPFLSVSADYDIDGRILVLPLKGKGIFKGNFTNSRADVKATGKLIKNKKGVQFIQAKDINVKLSTSGDQQVKIINKGSKDTEAITQTATNFYNQNKQQVQELVMPIVEETVVAFLRQFANTILHTVPYNELLPN